MTGSIVPAGAKTSSTVSYGLEAVTNDCYIIAMQTVGPAKDPVFIQALEPVVVHRDKCLYVGLISKKAKERLRLKEIGVQTDFETFRHAFVAPSDETMKKIRERLNATTLDGNFFSSVLLYKVVQYVIADEVTRKNWLALH